MIQMKKVLTRYLGDKDNRTLLLNVAGNYLVKGGAMLVSLKRYENHGSCNSSDDAGIHAIFRITGGSWNVVYVDSVAELDHAFGFWNRRRSAK